MMRRRYLFLLMVIQMWMRLGWRWRWYMLVWYMPTLWVTIRTLGLFPGISTPSRMFV